jgi:mono/diheme cytochrome c family protein
MSGIIKAICGAAGAFLLACAFGPAARGDNPGETLYKQKCTPCHAADGSGNNPMGKTLHARDLRSPEVQKHTDAELTEIITTGKDKMPAYGKTLKPEEIKGLVTYIRSIAAK